MREYIYYYFNSGEKRNTYSKEYFSNLNRNFFDSEIKRLKLILKNYLILVPLSDKDIFEKKNKILLSIYKCHFCLFDNLSLMNLFPKEFLRNFK